MISLSLTFIISSMKKRLSEKPKQIFDGHQRERERERERDYSCSRRAMIRGSSFMMSCGYHSATFSPMSFLRNSLWGDLWPVGLSMCTNILALASVTPLVTAVAKIFFRLPVAILTSPCWVKKKRFGQTFRTWWHSETMLSEHNNAELISKIHKFRIKIKHMC